MGTARTAAEVAFSLGGEGFGVTGFSGDGVLSGSARFFVLLLAFFSLLGSFFPADFFLPDFGFGVAPGDLAGVGEALASSSSSLSFAFAEGEGDFFLFAAELLGFGVDDSSSVDFGLGDGVFSGL